MLEVIKSLRTPIIFIIMVIALIVSIKGCLKKEKDIAELKDIIKLDSQSVKNTIDANGRLRSTINEIAASKENIDLFYGHKIDSISKLLKIKSKQLKELSVVGLTTGGNINGNINTSPTQIVHDTVYTNNGSVAIVSTDTLKFSIDTSDGHLKFRLQAYTDDKYKFKYSYTDTLTYAKYVNRYGFLNLKKEVLLNFSFSNKNSSVSGVKQFRINDIDKPKKLHLGLHLGYGFDGSRFKPVVSAGLNYNVF